MYGGCSCGQPSPPSQRKLLSELGFEAWAAVYQMLGDGEWRWVSFEEEGTAYVKTQRPETTQGCHGITVALEECKEVCGAGGKGTWGSRRLG